MLELHYGVANDWTRVRIACSTALNVEADVFRLDMK